MRNLIFPLAISLLTSQTGFSKNSQRAVVVANRFQELKKLKPRNTGSLGFLESQGTAEGKSESELIDMIKGFRLLINQEKPGVQRNNYLLAESSGYLALSKIYRVKREMTEKDKEREKNSNRRALKNTSEVFQDSKSSADQQGKSLYYGGMALINLGDYEGARKSFLQSIEVQPKSAYAPGMNLFIAENLFEKEKFSESLRQYGLFYKQYTNQQKALAIYKMGWCQLNLEKPQSAEKMFVLLAGQKWAGSFADDAIKDLAYISSFFRTEPESIQFAKTQFANQLPVRIQYLTELYIYFQNQSGNKKKPLLLNEILALETDIVKRLKVLILTLRSSQKGFASLEPIQDFQRIQAELKEKKLNVESPLFKEFESDLEIELLVMIKAYAETFFGKVKTNENLTPIVISKNLLELLAFHVNYFPKSVERPQTFQVWLNVCSEQKNYQCLYQISHQVIKEKVGTPEFQLRAELDLIKALDELSQKNASLKPELLKTLSDFLEKRKDDKNWLPLSKRLTFLLNQDKKYPQAIPWLKQIYEREKTTENLYRLLWVNFEMGDFEAISKAQVPTDGNSFSKDILKLQRESFLKLAAVQLEKNDFPNYEKNLKKFLALSDDPVKKDIAQKNYLLQLMDRKMFDHANTELLGLNYTKRLKGDFLGISLQLSQIYIKTDQFGKVEKLLEDPSWQTPVKTKKKKTPVSSDNIKKDVELIYLISSLGQDPQKLAKKWNLLSDSIEEHRDYLLSVLTLTSPGVLIEQLKNQKALSVSEARFLNLAYQLQQGKSQIQVDPHVAGMLKNLESLKVVRRINSQYEKSYQEIVFPNLKMSAAKYDRFAQDALNRLRGLRKKVVKDLENRSAETQLSLLNLAIEKELKGYESLLAAPSPSSLTPAQVTQYKTGLAELAQEFKNQSNEFIKIKVKVETDLSTMQTQKLKAPPMDRWFSSGISQKKDLEKCKTEKRWGACILILDQMKSLNEIKPDEYFILRTEILLSISNNEMMIEYLKQELESNGQSALVEKWRGLFADEKK